MILESTQILSTVTTERGYIGPYRPTHAHHPCVKWVASHPANWAWLIKHATYMCSEYTNRYLRVHKCESLIMDLAERSRYIWGNSSFEDYSDYYAQHTTFVQCMPNQYKTHNAVDAYRAYYIGEKSRFAKWAHSKQPSWFPNESI